MKKILFALLISLCLLSNVNAEEIDECYNDYLLNSSFQTGGLRYDVDTNIWLYNDYAGGLYTLSILLEAKPNTVYYIKKFSGSYNSDTFYFRSISFYDSDKKYISRTSAPYYATYSSKRNQVQFSIDSSEFPANAYYISITFMTDEYTFLSSGSIAFADFSLATCPIPPEPEVPEEPEIPDEPEIIPDTTLDNFYSIYVSKLKEFSDYALENKYILGTLAIILLFVILEIILNLFKKGGYR